MNTINLLTIILTVVLLTMVCLLIVLGIIFLKSKTKKKEDDVKLNSGEKQIAKVKSFKEYRVDSIMNFLEFDTVVDNMISQKDGKRYVMIVECQGINYDLMSEMEKNAVEEGFVQFLNTIRHPIQIYTQTRTINLESSIRTYKEKLREVEAELEKQEMQYKQMEKADTYTKDQLDRAYFELTKQRNLYEYGKDIISTTERMSTNKNVLNQKYYVVIPYFIEELDGGNFDAEEKRNIAFSELYTRAQSVIRTLAGCGVNGKVLNSNELVELLYMAYNRDEAEVYGLDKALRAGYDELYTTAQDVVEKQMKQLDKQIEEEAIELAREKVTQAQSEKQKAYADKQNRKRDLIDELAQLIIQENAQIIGEDIAEDAIDKIQAKEEGGSEDEQKETKRVRKTATAK